MLQRLARSFLFVLVAGAVHPAAGATCEDLVKLVLPDTTITAATSITPPFTVSSPQGGAAVSAPFCRVEAFLTPTSDSHIGIEVWLPPAGVWNHKYQAVGNGALAGALNPRAMLNGLNHGYATMTSDLGHVNSLDDPAHFDSADARWTHGHPEKIVDFGYRAAHLSTVAAKRIIEAYYGTGPQHSYFIGCSGGGHEALTESLRFPGDYDGYIIGDAGPNQINMWAGRAPFDHSSTIIKPEQLTLVHKFVLQNCLGKDGGLQADGFLTNPAACAFDPKKLLCKTGQDASTCLGSAQVQAFSNIYDGLRNPRTRELIDPGYAPGSETNWLQYLSKPLPPGAPAPYNPAATWPKLLAFVVYDDPDYIAKNKYQNFDFDKEETVALGKIVAGQTLGSIFNNDNPSLEPTKEEGAKIIHYHGWEDGNVPSMLAVDFYTQMVADQASRHGLSPEDALHETQSFYRLFMVPGMAHCMGGPGPNVFDTLTPLEHWVEKGVAPDKLVATKYTNNDPKQGVAMTRPLCPYPQIPKYSGSGDTNDATNFVCANPNSKSR